MSSPIPSTTAWLRDGVPVSDEVREEDNTLVIKGEDQNV